jgi:uncharacterized protein YndB with AHSA1/START domain
LRAPVKVNESAPAVASAEVEVAADPEIVWEVLTSIDDWPRWNPDVSSASLEEGLSEGARFRWKAGPGTITSTLQRIDRPRLIAWTGRTFGIKAIHVHRLEPRGEGTVVSSEESWEGLPVRIFRGRMQKTLEKSIEPGLGRLKAEAERRVS